MKVSQLRQTLKQLADLLEASGAGRPSKDLSTLVDALAEFDSETTSDLLKYARTGKKPPVTRDSKGGKLSKDEAVAFVSRIYSHPADPSVAEEAVNGIAAKILHLTKSELIEVAAAIELTAIKGLNKEPLALEIQKRVADQYGSVARNRTVATHPEAQNAVSNGARP